MSLARSYSQTSTTTLDDIGYTSTANQLTGYLYSEIEGFSNNLSEQTSEQTAGQAAEKTAAQQNNVGKWRSVFHKI